ncbi:lamin tail domain-containing protein [Candidatus Neomarinimicrobiota bacterium]
MTLQRLLIIIFMLTIILFGCNFLNQEKDDIHNGSSGTLVINEFLASNSTILADEHGDFDDWVEIYNQSDESINIGGMYIWGDPEDTIPFQIPDTDPFLTTVASKDFILLWFDRDSHQGALHIENKLSIEGDGESIILIDRDGETIIDSYEFVQQYTDISTGRFPDGSNNWVSFKKPTPGSSNHLTEF